MSKPPDRGAHGGGDRPDECFVSGDERGQDIKLHSCMPAIDAVLKSLLIEPIHGFSEAFTKVFFAAIFTRDLKL